jgi:hypothetical protein
LANWLTRDLLLPPSPLLPAEWTSEYHHLMGEGERERERERERKREKIEEPRETESSKQHRGASDVKREYESTLRIM